MKKKLLCIVLAAALLLGILVPGTALANDNKPAPPKAVTEFMAEMTVTWIEDTILYVNVIPRYGDGSIIPPEVLQTYNQPPDYLPYPADMTWEVINRQMTGVITGSFEGTITVTYSGILNVCQAGGISGSMVIDTRPGTNRGIIYGTFEGYTATVYYNPPIVKVIFLDDMVLSGGTGIYKHISGQGNFGTAEPIQLTVDVAGHVIGIEGSMSMSGTYNRNTKPVKHMWKNKGQ